MSKDIFEINNGKNKIDDDFLLSSQIGVWVYILKSKADKQLYVGSTNDLRRRFEEHNKGQVRSTKSRAPFELRYYEAYFSEEDARHREHSLKKDGNALAQLKRRIMKSIS